jgi:hypothetical protein
MNKQITLSRVRERVAEGRVRAAPHPPLRGTFSPPGGEKAQGGWRTSGGSLFW